MEEDRRKEIKRVCDGRENGRRKSMGERIGERDEVMVEVIGVEV